MYSYYLDRGFKLEYLINLSNREKEFYIASMRHNIDSDLRMKFKFATIGNPLIFMKNLNK